jgi:hypothetical protein
MGFFNLFRTRKNKRSSKPKKQVGTIQRIQLKELGDQFPKYDRDVFTIRIGPIMKLNDEFKTEVRSIEWLKVPSKCCKWNVPTVWDTMKKNTYYNKFWWLGDVDYEVIFL